MTEDFAIFLGDLVHYVGPPVVSPMKWEYIVKNDNGIINQDDVGIVIKCDFFLKIANVYFQQNKIVLERVSFKHLKIIY